MFDLGKPKASENTDAGDLHRAVQRSLKKCSRKSANFILQSIVEQVECTCHDGDEGCDLCSGASEESTLAEPPLVPRLMSKIRKSLKKLSLRPGSCTFKSAKQLQIIISDF